MYYLTKESPHFEVSFSTSVGIVKGPSFPLVNGWTGLSVSKLKLCSFS